MIEKHYYLQNLTAANNIVLFFFKANYLAGTCSEQMKLMESLSVHHRSLVHVERLLRTHDNIYGYGKRETVHHLCNLLMWNTVFVPPR